MELRQQSKQQRMFYLDIARVLAIISITLNHAVNRSYQNYHAQNTEFFTISTASTIIKTLTTVFSRVGVPLFLMITGVLILNKKMESASDVKRFYKHNLLSLFITAEIWYVLIYWYLVLFSSETILETRGWGGAILGMFETMLFQNQVTFDGMWYIPMILCIYLFLPFITIVKDKLAGSKEPVLLLPSIVVFVVTMVMPFVNNLLILLGQESYTSGIEAVYLPVFYYLYVLLGYWIGKGGLKKLKTTTIIAVTGISFLVCCGFQFWAYSRPANYLVAYDFPLMPLLTGFLFELLRRSAERFRKLERPITGLARFSFGIYFLHIVIMTTLVTLLSDWQVVLLRPVRLLVLETVSVGLSIVLILPLSKIKFFRKYVFLIK